MDKHLKKKIFTPVVIILVSGSIAAAMIWQKREPDKNEVIEQIITVDTVKLQAGDMNFTISSQGNVSPHTETTLVSEISSVVVDVSPDFVAGGFFKKGEILLRLDPSDYEVAVEQARANLLIMKARLAREEAQAEQAEKEWGMSGRPRSAAPPIALRIPYLEEARANVLFAEADLKKAERKLKLTIIRAPYDGMIREKLVDVGQYVSSGTQLARSFAVDFAEVRLPLTDQDIAYLDLPRPANSENAGVKNGPEVELTSIIGGMEYKWPANIVRTEGVIDQRTRVHYAIARIADPYNLSGPGERPPIPIGSFVKAGIKGKLVRNVIALPLSAIRAMDQVLIKDVHNRLRIYKIAIIRTDKDFAYIKAGDLENQEAITTAVYNPVDGMPLHSSKDS
jgi:RND family efflux transporter MFP subunit